MSPRGLPGPEARGTIQLINQFICFQFICTMNKLFGNPALTALVLAHARDKKDKHDLFLEKNLKARYIEVPLCILNANLARIFRAQDRARSLLVVPFSYTYLGLKYQICVLDPKGQMPKPLEKLLVCPSMFEFQLSDLLKDPRILEGIRKLKIICKSIERVREILALPWKSLTKLYLSLPGPADFGSLTWPGTLEVLVLVRAQEVLVLNHLPEGLKEIDLYVMSVSGQEFSLGTETGWPLSMRKLTMNRGTLIGSHVPDLIEAQSTLFHEIPKTLQVWLNMRIMPGTEKIFLPELQVASFLDMPQHLARVQFHCPKLACLTLQAMSSVSHQWLLDELAQFNNLTCLTLNSYSMDTQFPPSLLSINILSVTPIKTLERQTFPKGLKALMLNLRGHCLSETLNLPGGLELLNLVCSKPTVTFRLPNLRFLYLEVWIHGQDPNTFLLEGNPPLDYARVSLYASAAFSGSRYVLNQPLDQDPLWEDSTCRIKPGTPAKPWEAWEALKLIQTYQ